jgi:hypothetical protein
MGFARRGQGHSHLRLDLNAVIPRVRAASLTSIRTTLSPAVAAICAIPLPIVPAPTTPIVSIVMFDLWQSNSSLRLLKIFEDGRDTLTATDAHGHQREAAVNAFQFMESLDGDQCAGCADRMTQ